MFQTTKQTKIFQNVVEQIQEAIFDGRLKTGETLPAERELKSMFNVSRGTLREALRVLDFGLRSSKPEGNTQPPATTYQLPVTVLPAIRVGEPSGRSARVEGQQSRPAVALEPSR